MSEKELHVDDDWKNRAEAEKRAADLKRQQAAEAADGDGDEIPEASFPLLVNTLAMQAISALGQMPDPQTGEAMIHKPLAQHMIDLLAVLEEKTKGNLDKDESGMLTQVLTQLRMVYVQTPDVPPGATVRMSPAEQAPPAKKSSIIMP